MTILCVTPNPAIDRTVFVPGFAAGGVWRAKGTHVGCGGKGVNVARALRCLGQDARCMGPIGGQSGTIAAEAAACEGLAAHWTWIVDDTRTCVIVTDHQGEATVINEPGPTLSAGEWLRFRADVEAAARGCSVVCISGSLPGGCPSGGMASLAAAAAAAPELWVDSSGKALADAMSAPGIKINDAEAASLLGGPVRGIDAAAAAAAAIRARGPRRVVVTLGAAGAVLAEPAGRWFAAPPRVAAVNPVGSGDSFLAGLVAGLADGRPAPDALRLAVACGAVNAMVDRAGDLDRATVARIEAEVVVGPVG
jgi:1-phosphofructokinase family hexose kinase